MAAASVPWRTEALAYASDLGDRLPDGLSMPRALGVYDLDELSAAIWLEEVDRPAVAVGPRALPAGGVPPRPDGGQPPGRAAAPTSATSCGRCAPTSFGRLGMQVLPVLRSEEIWHHPAIAAAFDTDLRDRLLRRGRPGRQRGSTSSTSFPLVTTHGDYSPNNLLPGPTPDSFTLIDFGFWVPNPIGFDLGQLLVGDVQLGRRSPSLLARDRGRHRAGVRRGHGGRGHGRRRGRPSVARTPCC